MNADKNWERLQGVDLTTEGQLEYRASVINRLQALLERQFAERDKLQWMLFRVLLQMYDGDSFKALAKWGEMAERYEREGRPS